MLFEKKYTELIEPLYGKKRNQKQDEFFLNEKCENIYKINYNDRVDFTNIEVYNIDPPNCNDVDDAFSIYVESNILYLAIHIADPTEYISLQSNLWKDIVQRVTTKYPTNRKPISLLPETLIELCSLCQNNDIEIKKAITIRIKIDKNTFDTIDEPELFFSIIRVSKKNTYSYYSASQDEKMLSKKHIFYYGLKIMEKMKLNRSKKTITTKLNDISFLQFYFIDNSIHIYTENIKEKLMKEMIAEFAIFTNSFIGKYLKKHLDCAIFRSCNSKNLLSTLSESSSGNDILYKIITNGISANYDCNNESHDLVGTLIYSHFTSPLRRLSDIICHFFLKFIYIQNLSRKPLVEIPFSKDNLEFLIKKCLLETKKDKKIQYTDKKFRILQVIEKIIQIEKKVNIEFFYTSYTGLFLNLIISKVNEYNTHISYTLRIEKSKNKYTFHKKEKIIITQINCFQKYDENTFPELDKYVKNFYEENPNVTDSAPVPLSSKRNVNCREFDESDGTIGRVPE